MIDFRKNLINLYLVKKEIKDLRTNKLIKEFISLKFVQDLDFKKIEFTFFLLIFN